MVKFFGKFLSLLKDGGSVVDLGAGDGWYSTRLAEAGLRVTAIDLRESPVDHVSIEWIVQSIEEWIHELPVDFTADGYLLKNIAQFIEKRKMLEEILPGIAARLVPGGVIAIETFRQPAEPPLSSHISFYTTKELLAPFKGWKVEMEEETDEDAKDHSGNVRKFHLARVIVKKP